MSLSEEIKDYAFGCGLDLVGITTADPFPEYLENILERQRVDSEGFPESMWGRLKRRADPRNALPNAESVIVLGFYYFDGESVDATAPGRPCGVLGRVYYYGYTGLREPANRVQAFLQARGFKVVRGGAPEKAAAVRAGLGWFGKNSLIQTTRFGSWVTYATLVTDAELECDDPYEGPGCGPCQRCMEACPTGAIYAPYRVAASRCFSHITYRRGVPYEPDDYVPAEFREKMGRYFHGCDVCQEVCPNNRNLTPTKKKLGYVRPEILERSPPLIPFLTMSEEEFRRRVPVDYLNWQPTNARVRHQRNAAIVLGNIGDRAAVPALAEALHDPEDVVRSHAAWALGKIGGPQAKRALREALGREGHPRVRSEIEGALKALR